MSTYRKEGKDVIIFATADDHKQPSTVKLPEPEPQAGLILPNGEINWNCPCLGGMATGPCGVEFREAFSCFHNSEADPKGSDCFDAFKEMHLCMAEYPKLYNKYNEDDEDDLDVKLTDAEKALISEDTLKDTKEKEKVNIPKMEEKSKILTESKVSTSPTIGRFPDEELQVSLRRAITKALEVEKVLLNYSNVLLGTTVFHKITVP